jgi:hypothetical protein
MNVQNASEVRFEKALTLNHDRDGTHAGRGILRFSGCRNLFIRDLMFLQSGPQTTPGGTNSFSPNPSRVSLQLADGNNRNVEISGNMFAESGIGIAISPGTANVQVLDNRFFPKPGSSTIQNREPSTRLRLLPPERLAGNGAPGARGIPLPR